MLIAKRQSDLAIATIERSRIQLFLLLGSRSVCLPRVRQSIKFKRVDKEVVLIAFNISRCQFPC